MRKRTIVPFLAVSAALLTSAIISCRSKPDSKIEDSTAAPHPTASQESGDGVEESDEPPDLVTTEVTRVVIETEVVVVTSEPTKVESEPKELTICISEEPDGLYPLGLHRTSLAVGHIGHAIYESLYTTRSFEYQARGLEKLPNLADGDAAIKSVIVSEGDKVVNTNGDVVTIREGTEIFDNLGQAVEFDGTPIVMQQMVVDYVLKPLIWSDGVPVTADDSVFSFQLASDPHTPVPKDIIARTSSYKATDELTIEWIGLPGYFDRNYFTNVWPPLPRHYWGELSPEELIDSEIANRQPISSGPFVMSEWIEGDYIALERNQYYYLADEGLPKVDRLRYIFVPSSDQLIASLLSGECDIATQEGFSMSDMPSLLEAEQNGLIVPYHQIGTVFEHIDFGINPVPEYAEERPDWFEDVRVRTAILMCTDRQSMVDDFLFGQSQVVHAYVPSSHPLYPDNIIEWPYDPAAANALLDTAGYIDNDEDGLREDPRTGTRFQVELLSSVGNDLAEKVAYRLRDNLADCGIEIMPVFMSGEQYFADGPEGPLFGRRFDLGAFPWLISIEPNCALYLTSRIPGPNNAWNRSYNNETGFSNEAFDDACNAALATLPGMPEYEESHRQAMRIWAENIPIIPLFMRLKISAARPEVLNLKLDPTQPSELWNLYEIDLEG